MYIPESAKITSLIRREAGMEFHENRAKQPFIGLVQVWRAIKRGYLRAQTRRVLRQMSDERLKDVGLRRDQVE